MPKFRKANYTQIPHEILDELMPVLTGAQFKVLMLIARRTLGFHRDSHAISLERIAKGTGLSRQGVIDSVEFLEAKEYILKEKRISGDGISSAASLYSLNAESDDEKDGGVVNSVDYGWSTELTTGSQLAGLRVVNSVDPYKEEIKVLKESTKEKDFTIGPVKGKKEESKPTADLEDGKQEQNPPGSGDPSQAEHLTSDVESTDIIATPITEVTAKYVFTRLKRKMGVNKFTQNSIKATLAKLDCSEEIVLAMTEAFLEDTFWATYDNPASALAGYLEKSYLDDFKTPRPAQGKRPGKRSGFKLSLTTTRPPKQAPRASIDESTKSYVERWNAIMPDKSSTDLREFIVDKLDEAIISPEFVGKFDELCQRCLKIKQAGVYDIPGFNWLFKTASGKDVNWARVLDGDFAWAEKPKDQKQARQKSPGELAEERYQKALKADQEKKANGTQRTEPSNSGKDAGVVLGVPVRADNDRERDKRLGIKSA